MAIFVFKFEFRGAVTGFSEVCQEETRSSRCRRAPVNLCHDSGRPFPEFRRKIFGAKRKRSRANRRFVQLQTSRNLVHLSEQISRVGGSPRENAFRSFVQCNAIRTSTLRFLFIFLRSFPFSIYYDCSTDAATRANVSNATGDVRYSFELKLKSVSRRMQQSESTLDAVPRIKENGYDR